MCCQDFIELLLELRPRNKYNRAMDIRFEKANDENLNQWKEINNSSDSSFLTSLEWGEFQKTLNKDISGYVLYDDETPFGIMYVENNKRRIAKYAYAPFNPVINWEMLARKYEFNRALLVSEVFHSIRKFMKFYIKEKGLTVFRFDPLLPSEFAPNILEIGFDRTLAAVGPRYILEIDLGKEEEVLLAEMKKVARYNIRTSEKAGIEIYKVKPDGLHIDLLNGDNLTESIEDDYIKKFFDILDETSSRHGFATFDLNYYRKEFDLLNSKGLCDLFLAKYQDKFISSAFVNYNKDTAYYTHGGSVHDKELQKFGASYLLHWSMMKHFMSKGLKKYNMWGVLPDHIDDHPLSGVSDFKKRFGGEVNQLAGGFEVYNSFLGYLVNRTYDWWVSREDRIS